MAKTASFTSPGVLPPYAADMALAQEEQQRLAEALAQAQKQGSAQPIQAGRLSALNFDGVGNAIREALLEKKTAAARKKSADTQGAYQAELLRGLKAYTSERDGGEKEVPGPPEPGQTSVTQRTPPNPLAYRSGELSPFPEVRGLAENDRKFYENVVDKALPKASLSSIQASGGNLAGLVAKPDQRVVNNAVMNFSDTGAPPTVVPGMGVTQERMPNGTLANRRPGGELDVVEKAPKTSVVNNVSMPGQRGDIKFLEATGGNLATRADELQKTLPGQLRALADAEISSQKGAFQGPISSQIQWAAGLLNQFGLAPDEAKRMLQNTETLNSDMGRFVLSALKATGTNPSNADREYAERTAGGQKLTPEGLQSVIRAGRADVLNNVLEHNKSVDRVASVMPNAQLAKLPLPKGAMNLTGYALNEDGLYMPVGGKVGKKPSRYTAEQRKKLIDAGITPAED